MRKKIKQIWVLIFATLFVVSTSGIVFFEHHCHCTNKTFLTFTEKNSCCESHFATDKPSKPCCDQKPKKSICISDPSNERNCCHSEKVLLQNSDPIYLSVEKNILKTFTVFFKVIMPLKHKEPTVFQAYHYYDPPFKLCSKELIVSINKPTHAPPRV